MLLGELKNCIFVLKPNQIQENKKLVITEI